MEDAVRWKPSEVSSNGLHIAVVNDDDDEEIQATESFKRGETYCSTTLFFPLAS